MKTRILQIKCPNCGSKIEATNDVNEYRCPYCDSAFLVEGRGRNITKLGLAALDAAKDISDKKIEHKRWKEEQKRKEQRNKLIGGFALLAICLILLFTMKSPEKADDITNANDTQNDVVVTEDVKETKNQDSVAEEKNEDINDDTSYLEKTTDEEDLDEDDQNENAVDPSTILITEDNLEEAAVGNKVLLTGIGDVYRGDGIIYINDFFSNCGVRIDVQSTNGTWFEIDAEKADPGEFDSVFRSYPPAAFGGSTIELGDGYKYDPCTMTLSGTISRIVTGEDDIPLNVYEITDAKVENLVVNRQ